MDNNNFNQENQQSQQPVYQQPQQPVYQQPQQPIYQQPQQTPGNGAGIASMVCGILSIVFCWCYGVIGLILGIIALVMYGKCKEANNGVPTGMAKAGLACGVVGVICSALMIIYFIFVIVVAGEFVTSLDAINYYY